MSFLKEEKGIPYKTLINGGIVGAVESVLTYPTEFVKTHLQLQSKTNPEYRGIWHCVTKTVSRDGFFGLYRGLGPLVVGSIPKQGVRWFSYDLFSSQLKGTGELTSSKRAVAGFGAGCTEALLAVVPMETIKTKIIHDRKQAKPQFSGALDGVIKIIGKEGFMGIYRGVGATVAKQGLNQATRFPFQNMFVQLMADGDKSKHRDPMINGIAGMLAGGVSVIVTQPADVIKTRMQGYGHGHGHVAAVEAPVATATEAMAAETAAAASGVSGAKPKPVVPAAGGNMLSVGVNLLKTEGPMFFYAGTAPRMLRVCFDAGATFAVFPLIQQAMDKYVWGVAPKVVVITPSQKPKA